MKKQQLVLIGLCLLFITGGIVAAFQANRSVSSENTARKIEENLVKVLTDLDRQANDQLKRIRQAKPLAVSDVQFLLIDESKILEWSGNHFVPSFYILSGAYDLKYIRLTSGDFIIKKIAVDPVRSLVAVIPLHIQYRISNDYLKPYWHPEIFDNRNVLILLPELTQGYPITVNGQVIFKVVANQKSIRDREAQAIATGFLAIATVLILILIGG